jgi:hypothetical protein
MSCPGLVVSLSPPEPCKLLSFIFLGAPIRRMFEALATGCVPVVSSPLKKMKTDLPFPSLIDWDQVALHTEQLPLIQRTSDGLERLGKVRSCCRCVCPTRACRVKTSEQCMLLVCDLNGDDDALSTIHSLLKAMMEIGLNLFAYLTRPWKIPSARIHLPRTRRGSTACQERGSGKLCFHRRPPIQQLHKIANFFTILISQRPFLEHARESRFPILTRGKSTDTAECFKST